MKHTRQMRIICTVFFRKPIGKRQICEVQSQMEDNAGSDMKETGYKVLKEIDLTLDVLL